MKPKRKVHPDVAAWNKWWTSEEGANCGSGTAGGVYLYNRLWFAFMAGRKSVERTKPRKRER